MNKVKNILTIKNLLIFIFFVICFLLFLFDLKSEKHNLTVYLLFSLFAIFTLGFIILLNQKFGKINSDAYHKFYAFAVLIMGITFMIISPPFSGSDERTHFFRAYEITEGHYVSHADENGILAAMPRSLNKAYSGYDNQDIYDEDSTISYEKIPSRLSIPLNKEDIIYYCSCNKTNYYGGSMYSPFQYLPHLIGIEIGKFLNLGPTWILYLARLFHFLAFAVLTTIGLKLLPKFKLPAMLILLSPVVLSGATTISADGITNATIFVFIAYILNLRYSQKKIKAKQKILLALLAFMISMCKVVYFPIIALVFLLQKQQFKNAKDNLLFKLSLIIIGTMLSLGWLSLASAFMNSQSSTSEGQIHFVLTHPFEFIFIIIRTYLFNLNTNLSNLFFGDQMYHWSLDTYSMFSLAYVAIIFLSLFTEKANLKLSKTAKILIIILEVIILGLIASALFVQNNAEASSVIGGIQARYFIPLCFISLLLLNIKKAKFNAKFIFTLFSLLYIPVLLTIIVRFI